MAAEWLRAAQVAAETAGHHEVLTTFTDLTGRTNTLREGGCVKCGARWPCLTVQWAAQDGRWRALVEELLAALHDAPITHVQTALWLWHDGEPCVVSGPPSTTRLLAALNTAQAALDGAPGEG